MVSFDRGLCAFPLFELPAGEDPSRVYYGSDTRCFALLIGGLIGLRHRPQRKRRESRPHLYVIAFLILLVIQLLPYFVADGERPETYWLLLFPTAWIGAALIDLCAKPLFLVWKAAGCSPPVMGRETQL